MYFNLTLTILLVFFVPGALMLIGTCFVFPEIREFLGPFLKEPKTPGTVLIFAVCFVIGVLLDAVRLITIHPMVKAWKKIKAWKKMRGKCTSPPDYIGKLTNENLPVFTMVVKRSYEYFRLHANVTVSILFLLLCHIVMRKFNLLFWILVLVALVAIRITVKSDGYTEKMLSEFTAATDKE